MEQNREHRVYRFEKGMLRPRDRGIVREFPLRLNVNGRELATLVASPHQLNFLVAGFFRLQGFIDTLDDLLTLGICDDFGAAYVRLRGEVPEQLRPTLTSGCGTGIAFNLPGRPVAHDDTGKGSFSPAAIFSLMGELARKAENYSSHGGIHSAAVGDGRRLLLYAEDLGRHNTLDRIAGEALFKGIDLAGRMLVTSGRISTEMVAKSTRLGISLIASRTSPTDQAVRLAEEAGITLLGYVRGESFEAYSHPQRIAIPTPSVFPGSYSRSGQGGEEGATQAYKVVRRGGPDEANAAMGAKTNRVSGITGVILAGGESRRMGCDKSLLPIDGARFIDHIFRRMSTLFDEVIIVTNSPGLYQDIPCRKVPDVYPGMGSLAGIHSGLYHSLNDKIFVVACDMPLLFPGLIRYICEQADRGDVIIPGADDGLQPLHALYRKSCLPAIEGVLDSGQRRIVEFFPRVQVHTVEEKEFATLDPQGLSFRNINTPKEYFTLREEDKTAATPPSAMQIRR